MYAIAFRGNKDMVTKVCKRQKVVCECQFTLALHALVGKGKLAVYEKPRHLAARRRFVIIGRDL